MKKIILLVLLVGALIVAGCGSSGDAVQPASSAAASEASTSSSDSGASESSADVPKATDFTLNTLDGNSIQLSDFSAQGKPVLLYFFASWCPFCARDFSALEKIYPDYQDDVVIVAIDIDPQETASQISAYKAKYPGISEAVFAQADAIVLSAYGVRTTTTKYAIDREGGIIYAGSGAIDVQQWTILLDALKNS